MRDCFGASLGKPSFEPAADLNGDGDVDVSDLAILGANFHQTGGDPDTTAPGLLITLNDIPDHMNDLLVVPPDRFQITLLFDSGGHSVVDRSSLAVTSSEDIGPYAAGTDLAPQFTVTPTRAVWEIPAGSDLARTSHYLTASIRDRRRTKPAAATASPSATSPSAPPSAISRRSSSTSIRTAAWDRKSISSRICASTA